MKKMPILLLLVVFLGVSYTAHTADVSKETKPGKGEEVDDGRLPPVPYTPSAMVAAIDERQAELDLREQQLEEKEKRLNTLDAEVTAMLQKNTKLRDDIELQESLRKKAAEERAAMENAAQVALFVRLSKVYGAMEPEEASQRIEELEEPLALQILGRVKPKIAAKILALLEPKKAASYTEQLAILPK